MIEGSKTNTNFRPRQWRSFRNESFAQSLKQHEEQQSQSGSSDRAASSGSLEEPVAAKRTGLVRRMASQILSASSAGNHPKPSSVPLSLKENSTFKTAVEDLKKVMNDQEFKQLNASIYSEVKKKKPESDDMAKPTAPQLTIKNKLTELNGSFHLEETEKGIKIQVKQPHLVLSSISSPSEAASQSGATKTSIRIYPLRLGRTTIGSAASNDIVLNGAGVDDEHCYIENVLISDDASDAEAQKDSSAHLACCKSQEPSDDSADAPGEQDSKRPKPTKKMINLVTLYPLAQLCAVDGVLIEDPYRLSCGNMLSLGELHYLRYNNPADETNDPSENDILIKMRTSLRMDNQQASQSEEDWSRERYMYDIKESANALAELKSSPNDQLKKILKIAPPKPPQRSLSLNGAYRGNAGSEAEPISQDNQHSSRERRAPRVRFNLPAHTKRVYQQYKQQPQQHVQQQLGDAEHDADECFGPGALVDDEDDDDDDVGSNHRYDLKPPSSESALVTRTTRASTDRGGILTHINYYNNAKELRSHVTRHQHHHHQIRPAADADELYSTSTNNDTEEMQAQSFQSGTEDGDLTSSSLSGAEDSAPPARRPQPPPPPPLPFRSHGELSNQLNLTRSARFNYLQSASRFYHQSHGPRANLFWIPGYGLLRS